MPTSDAFDLSCSTAACTQALPVAYKHVEAELRDLA